jgi:RHS repeat-associated protein
MVAWNEKFSHSENLASDGSISPDVIEGFDFTKRSEEARGGSVAIFGVLGFWELPDASPLRRLSAAPLNRNDPETQLYYVRNRIYNPALGRWGQRDPIGYSGGINLHEYVMSDPLGNVDPSGESGPGFAWSQGWPQPTLLEQLYEDLGELWNPEPAMYYYPNATALPPPCVAKITWHCPMDRER